MRLSKKYLFIIFAIVSLISLIITFDPQLGYIDDNSHYLNLGKAIYSGNGFNRIDLPGNPPENSVSPGLPAIYALIFSIFGDSHNLIPIKIFSSLSFWFGMMFLFFILIKHLKVNKYLTFLIMLTISFNPRITVFASMCTTEAPYIFASMVTLYLLMEFSEKRGRVFLILSILMSIVTLYIKITALPFVIAVILWFLLSKNYKETVFYTVSIFAGLAPWLLPKIISNSWGYSSQIVPSLTEKSVSINGTVEGIQQSSIILRYLYRFAERLPINIFRHLSELIFPFFRKNVFTSDISKIAILLGCIIILPIVFLLIKKRKSKSYSLFGIYSFIYILSYSFLSSCSLRYISVLGMPFFVLMTIGYDDIIRSIRETTALRKVIMSIFISTNIFLLIPSYLELADFTSQTKQAYRKSGKANFIARTEGYRYGKELELSTYFEALTWCSDNIPDGKTIVSSQTRSSFFLANRIALQPKQLFGNEIVSDLDSLNHYDKFCYAALRLGIEYFIIDNAYYATKKTVVPVYERYKPCFTLLHQTGKPSTKVFRIDKDKLHDELSQAYMIKLEDEVQQLSHFKKSKDYDNVGKILENHQISDDDLDRFIRLLYQSIITRQMATAIEVLNVANAYYPENPDLWFNFGIGMVRSIDNLNIDDQKGLNQRSATAINAFEKAMEYGGNKSECFNNIGVVKHTQGKIDEAITYYYKAFALDPIDDKKFHNLIDIIVSSGQKKILRKLMDVIQELSVLSDLQKESYITVVEKHF